MRAVQTHLETLKPADDSTTAGWDSIVYFLTYSRHLKAVHTKTYQAYRQFKLLTLSDLLSCLICSDHLSNSDILTLKAHAHLQFLVGRCIGCILFQVKMKI